MVKVASAIGKVAATVSTKFSKRFDMEVSWQRIDAKGNELEDEEDITNNGNTPTPGSNGNNPTPGGSSSSSDDGDEPGIEK